MKENPKLLIFLHNVGLCFGLLLGHSCRLDPVVPGDQGVRAAQVVRVVLLALGILLGLVVLAVLVGLHLQGDLCRQGGLWGLEVLEILVVLLGLDLEALLVLNDGLRAAWSLMASWKSGGSKKPAGWVLSSFGISPMSYEGYMAVARWELDCSLGGWNGIAVRIFDPLHHQLRSHPWVRLRGPGALAPLASSRLLQRLCQLLWLWLYPNVHMRLTLRADRCGLRMRHRGRHCVHRLLSPGTRRRLPVSGRL